MPLSLGEGVFRFRTNKASYTRRHASLKADFSELIAVVALHFSMQQSHPVLSCS